MSSKRKKPAIPASTNSASSATPADDAFDHENPATATIEVTAVEVTELTEAEQNDCLHLERRVERAFFEAGKALTELRDRRLYRSTHKTFEEYCRHRFGFSRRQPYHLMEAAAIFDNLVEACERNDHILPTNEWQVRPLTKLDPDRQPEAWQQAALFCQRKSTISSHCKRCGAKNNGAHPSTQHLPVRRSLPNPCEGYPDLKGKGGCWAIVSQVNQFSCTVKMWDGEYTVAVKHLKSYEYLPAECEQMRLLCDRISRLRGSENLEEAARAVLKHLGELTRPYLTVVEEKFLGLIEQEYSVID